MHGLLSPQIRAIRALQKAHAGELFQPYPDTYEDRYPALFERLAQVLAGREAPRILSFGCSSGAEVRALRERIADAQITGIDLNPAVIAEARAADPDHAESYHVAGRPPVGETYDAILALAVFRHGMLERYRPDTCTASLPFAQFAQGIAMLDAALQPGGYLAIYNAHFRLQDTAVAERYRPDPLRLHGYAPQTLAYGPDDRRLVGEANPPVLYRKLA